MSKHTPGPWRAYSTGPQTWSVVGPNTKRPAIATCFGPERDYNVLLIASAPDLLQTLKEARQWIASDYDENGPSVGVLSILAQIDAVLAKGVKP
jgi:hypothetical protein